MSVDILQREVDEMGLWIDGHRMRVLHLKGTEQRKALSAILKDRDLPRLGGDIQAL
jgi:hypothetical protein